MDPVDQPGGVSTVDHERARTATPIAPPTPRRAAPRRRPRRRLPRARRPLRGPIIVGAAALAIGLGLLGHQLGLDGGVRAGVVAADLGRDRARGDDRRVRADARPLRASAAARAEALHGRRRRRPRREPRRSTGSGPTRRSCARSSRTAPPPTGPITGRFDEPTGSPRLGAVRRPRRDRRRPPRPRRRRRPARRGDRRREAARQAMVDRTEALFTAHRASRRRGRREPARELPHGAGRAAPRRRRRRRRAVLRAPRGSPPSSEAVGVAARLARRGGGRAIASIRCGPRSRPSRDRSPRA